MGIKAYEPSNGIMRRITESKTKQQLTQQNNNKKQISISQWGM